MKKAILISIVLAALSAMVLAGIRGQRRNGRGIEVYAELATRGDITQVVKATGRVDPKEKVDLSAHVIAKIERLFVDEGDEVEAGQPVIELERETFQAVWERAEAQQEIARNQQRQADVDHLDAMRKAHRYADLATQGVVATERSEDAKLALETAELQQVHARERLRQAQADLVKATDDLAKVTIFSPIAGRVIALNAEEGEVVVSGTMNNPASVIATIADLSEILVEIDVDETEIVGVRAGQSAEVEVDAVQDHIYRGRVVEIGSSGYQRPGKGDVVFYGVKVLLEDADSRLRPGMTARAEIAVDTHRETIVLPIQSVVYRAAEAEESAPTTSDEEVQAVFMVEDGVAHLRRVSTGLADTTHIEITEGIEAGTSIVTGPYRSLRDLSDTDEVQVADPDDGEEDEKS